MNFIVCNNVNIHKVQANNKVHKIRTSQLCVTLPRVVSMMLFHMIQVISFCYWLTTSVPPHDVLTANTLQPW